MSSLNVTSSNVGWRACPGPETTLDQLSRALKAFPQLELDVDHDTLAISFVIVDGHEPDTEELAQVMFADDEELIVSEDTGTFFAFDSEESFDLEAQDRNAEPA